MQLSRPRFTHLAIPVSDLDASISFYETFTPLSVLRRFEDDNGRSSWLIDPSAGDDAFVLVLVAFTGSQRSATLAPFAHLGIEVPTRVDLEAIADGAREAGVLQWEPQDLPFPVGYVCALSDPDGNVVEISHGQGVFDALASRDDGATDNNPSS